MKKELTCIGCPMGCALTAEAGQDGVAVRGNACPRGEAYARDELTSPTRMVTGLVAVLGGRAPISVKTARAIPKERVFDCLRAMQNAAVMKPVHSGDAVIENVCGTGVDVIATRDAY